MAINKRGRRRFECETLESRDVPSGMGMGGHAPALQGTATATLVSQDTLPDGGLHTTASIAGHSRLLGNFTGQLDNVFTADHQHETSTGVFTTPSGAEIDFSLQADYNAKAPVASSSTGRFTITGGTGQFANATGGGIIHRPVLQQSTQATSFRFNGTVRE